MTRSRAITAAVCGGLFLLALSLVLPRTAVGLQAGDGAEYALAALRGTLIHPPGFPLYGTIGAWLVDATGTHNPYAVMAIFSACCQAIAAALLALVCVRLSGSLTLAAVIALAWFCYEPTLRTATDAEVFAMHHLIAVAIALQAVVLLRHPGVHNVGCAVLGFLCGLGGAHQPIVIFWAPLAIGAVAVVGYRARRLERPVWLPVVLMLGGAALGLGPYLLLFGRYAAEPVLAFGQIESLLDVVAHAGRDIYGTFNIHQGQDGDSSSYIGHFFAHGMWSLPVFLIAPVATFVVAWRLRRISSALFGLTFLSHLIFVTMLRFPAGGYDEVAVRFYPSAMLAAAFCVADCVTVLTGRRRWMAVLFVAVALPALSNLPYALERADARADVRGEIYMEEAMREIPHRALWLTSTDTSSFGAVYWQAGLGLRPDIEVVVTGRLLTPWYGDRLRARMPLLVTLSEEEMKNPAAIARAALGAGRPVVAEPMGIPSGLVGEPRGVVMQWYRAGEEPGVAATAQHLLAFCARWPDELAAVPLARRDTIWLWKGGFEGPLLRVMTQAAGRAGSRHLAEGAVAIANGDAAGGRELCASGLGEPE